MAVVAFDSMGTLFELTPLEELLGSTGLEAWFERLLHSAAVLALTGEFAPFDQLVTSTFGTSAAKLRLDAEPDAAVAALGELPPADDARAALESVRDAGGEPWVLTNGSRANTQRLLAESGLDELVAELHTVEEAGAYKPDRRVYELLPPEATLIAAHAWDVVGATAAGRKAIWVDRSERAWPFPGEPAQRASSLVGAVELVSGR